MKHIIYHGFCLDGFTSAWIIWNWLKRSQGTAPDAEPNGAVFYSASYGEPPPDIQPGDEVYIVDFSFPLDQLVKLRDKASSLIVLDHHKTAMNDLKDFSNAIFDMERSGCGLTWDYFFPTRPRPLLVNYMEDRDLWRFNLCYSEEIFDYCSSHSYSFHTWDYLCQRLEQNFNECLSEGRAIKRFKHQVINNAINNSLIMLDGLPYLNLTKEFGSSACHEVIKRLGVSHAVYFYIDGNKTFYGIRGDGSVDVSSIAEKYGGGGHHNAAGWQFDKHVLPKDLTNV